MRTAELPAEAFTFEAQDKLGYYGARVTDGAIQLIYGITPRGVDLTTNRDRGADRYVNNVLLECKTSRYQKYVGPEDISNELTGRPGWWCTSVAHYLSWYVFESFDDRPAHMLYIGLLSKLRERFGDGEGRDRWRRENGNKVASGFLIPTEEFAGACFLTRRLPDFITDILRCRHCGARFGLDTADTTSRPMVFDVCAGCR